MKSLSDSLYSALESVKSVSRGIITAACLTGAVLVGGVADAQEHSKIPAPTAQDHTRAKCETKLYVGDLGPSTEKIVEGLKQILFAQKYGSIQVLEPPQGVRSHRCVDASLGFETYTHDKSALTATFYTKNFTEVRRGIVPKSLLEDLGKGSKKAAKKLEEIITPYSSLPSKTTNDGTGNTNSWTIDLRFECAKNHLTYLLPLLSFEQVCCEKPFLRCGSKDDKPKLEQSTPGDLSLGYCRQYNTSEPKQSASGDDAAKCTTIKDKVFLPYGPMTYSIGLSERCGAKDDLTLEESEKSFLDFFLGLSTDPPKAFPPNSTAKTTPVYATLEAARKNEPYYYHYLALDINSGLITAIYDNSGAPAFKIKTNGCKQEIGTRQKD